MLKENIANDSFIKRDIGRQLDALLLKEHSVSLVGASAGRIGFSYDQYAGFLD